MAMVEKNLRNRTFRLITPHVYDGREAEMIEGLCCSLADDVARMTGLGFRLYFEEYDLTHSKISWQAKLISLPEFVQTDSESTPIMTRAAQVSYEAFSHNNSKDNYHGCFSMMIQANAVHGDKAALNIGKKWMMEAQADSVLRLAESWYRSAIKNYYHEWGTHYKDALVFADNAKVFMHDLQAYPEFKEAEEKAK